MILFLDNLYNFKLQNLCMFYMLYHILYIYNFMYNNQYHKCLYMYLIRNCSKDGIHFINNLCNFNLYRLNMYYKLYHILYMYNFMYNNLYYKCLYMYFVMNCNKDTNLLIDNLYNFNLYHLNMNYNLNHIVNMNYFIHKNLYYKWMYRY